MNDQIMNYPRLNAEKRLRELEEIKGSFVIKVAENVYSQWVASALPFTFFAERYGFDVAKDPFILDFMDLKIQQETNVECLPKRERLDYSESSDRFAELHKKSFNYHTLDTINFNLVSFDLFWRIKHNVPADLFEAMISQDSEQKEEEEEVVEIDNGFIIGHKVKRICTTQDEYRRYKNAVYEVIDKKGHWLILKNAFGKTTKRLSNKYEAINS